MMTLFKRFIFWVFGDELLGFGWLSSWWRWSFWDTRFNLYLFYRCIYLALHTAYYIYISNDLDTSFDPHLREYYGVNSDGPDQSKESNGQCASPIFLHQLPRKQECLVSVKLTLPMWWVTWWLAFHYTHPSIHSMNHLPTLWLLTWTSMTLKVVVQDCQQQLQLISHPDDILARQRSSHKL